MLQAGRTRWVAVCAAYLLLVQTLITAFALGAAALGAPEHVAPICTSSTGPLPSPANDDRSWPLPSCCLAGCGLSVTTAPLLSPIGSLGRPQQVAVGRLNAVATEIPISPRERSPGRPRAPPAAR